MLTVPQAASLLGLSVDEVYQLCHGDRPPLAHYRVGKNRGRIRIKEEDLENYLRSCRVGGRESAPLRYLRIKP